MPSSRLPLAPLALLALPLTAGAQAAPADTGCVRPIPRSAYTRVPVFVHGEVVDSADRAARNSVDVMAQEVADRVRALVWAAATGGRPPADTATTLPPADTLLGDRGLSGRLRVVARRTGERLAWRVVGAERADTAAADAAGAAILARVLGAAAAEGAVFVPDDAMRGDSVAFELRFERPRVEGPARALRPVRVRNPTPAFSLAVPWERTAAAVPGTVGLRYPDAMQRAGYTGTLRLQFVVGVDGRAERGTVRDVWPTGTPRPTGSDGEAYRAFVAAGRAAVAGARFTPGAVAGCPVRQLVELPLAWTLNR